ncbi:MAG: type VI secretion system baseplate subunit TssF [Alphaproteobacteria bacterium]|nr:MAG: type VI secretion system baseplate subunit TssF [Alphaproteobacteria bacterium]
MDTRLLRYYEQELAFIREMGREFAEAYPKIAARLGIEGMEVLDPYVERLLEGFAFLAARVQLELDLQYPSFTQHLLEIVYPHYLAPIPSMMIARLRPDPAQGGMDSGFPLPRGTILRSPLREGEQTPVDYRTAHEVTLWPLEISQTEHVDSRGELVGRGIEARDGARAAMRLRLRRTDAKPIAALPLDTLSLHLCGPGREPWLLHEAILNRGLGLAAKSTDRRRDWVAHAEGRAIAPQGFAPEEALLPRPAQSFDGYRLIQEYFAIPQRFFFVQLSGLRPLLARAEGTEVDLYILLAEPLPEPRGTLAPEGFELFATPAINLFAKRCDRVPIDGRRTEYEVVADRTALMDFEIHSLTRVIGISGSQGEDTVFRPFYSPTDFTAAGERHEAYYTIRRRMRQRSERQRLKGMRTNYLGSDLFISLVDRAEAPYRGSMDQLSVSALVTNRDLPLLLPIGQGSTDFELPEGGPVAEVRAIAGPTRPRPSLAVTGDTGWRLVSHLALNYLSIAETGGGDPAAALREILGLYAPPGDQALSRQIEGLVSVASRPVVRRIPDRVLSTPVRGLEISLGFDESFFEGSSVYLLGAVLREFLARQVALNSFTETVIHSEERGEIARWPPTSGRRQLI